MDDNVKGVESVLRQIIDNTHKYLSKNKKNFKIPTENWENYKIVNNIHFYEDMNVMDFITNVGTNLKIIS